LVKTGNGTFTLTGVSTYAGTTRINAGILRLGAANAVPSTSAVTVAVGATLDLNNSSAVIGSLAGAGTVTLGSGTLTTGGNNTSTDFSGDISGTGGLIKMGLGTLTLSGGSNYSGPTLITAGTLVSGSQLLSNVTVSSGAALAGSGLLGNITANGTVSLGGPGTAVLRSGNAAFNAGSSFVVKIDGATPGSGYDQLIASGAVDLTGNPVLNASAGFLSGPGDSFTVLLSSTGITGTFNGLANNAVLNLSGQIFQIQYTSNSVILTRPFSPTVHLVANSYSFSIGTLYTASLPISASTSYSLLPGTSNTPQSKASATSTGSASSVGAGLIGAAESRVVPSSGSSVIEQQFTQSGTSMIGRSDRTSPGPSVFGAGPGSGSENPGQRIDFRPNDFLPPQLEPGPSGRTDIVSGFELFGASLLTGVRPTASLLPQKGPSEAPVGTVVPNGIGNELAIPTDPATDEKSLWPNSMIGLEHRIERRPVVAPQGGTRFPAQTAPVPSRVLRVALFLAGILQTWGSERQRNRCNE
jgi:autotransporter-associated beta strand protein